MKSGGSSGVPTFSLELLWPLREWSASSMGPLFSKGCSGGTMSLEEMLGLSDPWPECPQGAPLLCSGAWLEGEGPYTGM